MGQALPDALDQGIGHDGRWRNARTPHLQNGSPIPGIAGGTAVPAKGAQAGGTELASTAGDTSITRVSGSLMMINLPIDRDGLKDPLSTVSIPYRGVSGTEGWTSSFPPRRGTRAIRRDDEFMAACW